MKKEYMEWKLDDWVDMFHEIYGEKNERKTDEELWLHVVEEVSELAEDLRKQHIKPRINKKGEEEGVLVNLPDTFAWLSAFVWKHGSLEEMVWNKYPNLCSYCFTAKDCLCIARMVYMSKEEREEKLKHSRNDKKRYPEQLYDWQLLFKRIYGNVNKVQSFDHIGFHLMEEVGEVSKEIRRNSEKELREEIADVFAWLIGLILKCGDLIAEELRLDDVIWERYPDRCHRCGQKPCDCEEKHKKGPRINVS